MKSTLHFRPEYAVTHSGKPHPDDMVAGGILRLLWPDISITRVDNPTQKELFDSSIIVFDVGMKYQIPLNNFDHHQGSHLPAACMLVWNTLIAQDTRLNAEIKRDIAHSLMKFVSECDLDRKPDWYEYSFARMLALSVKPFGPDHYDEAYEHGVSMACNMLKGFFVDRSAWIQIRELWRSAKAYGPDNCIRQIAETIDFFPDEWYENARREGIRYVVVPKHSRRQLPMLYSCNGIIPSDPRRQLELASNGLSASYRSIDCALNHALELSLHR